MAITHVGSQTGQTGNGSTSGNWDLTGISFQQDDVAVCWYYVRDGTGITFTEPASVTQRTDTGTSTNGKIFVGHRVLQTGDTTFGWTASGPAGGATGDTTIWGMSVFRGVDTTTPFDVADAGPNTTSGINPDPAAITPTNANTCIVCIFGKNDDYTSITDPTNYSAGSQGSSTSGADGSAALAYRILTGGAGASENPAAWSLGGGAAGNAGYVVTMALREAVTTTALPPHAVMARAIV